jgi:hypothetical protein
VTGRVRARRGVYGPFTDGASSVKHEGHVEENAETQVARQERPLEPRPPSGVTRTPDPAGAPAPAGQPD